MFEIFLSLLSVFLLTLRSDIVADQPESATTPWDNKIYLATYPRSGNHWVRFLIEEATHVATGCVYAYPNDPKAIWFPWGYSYEKGYYQNCQHPKENELYIIKTHYPFFNLQSFELTPSTSKSITAIRVVRHPIDSIFSLYAYYNKIDEEQIKNFKLPSLFVRGHIKTWRKFQEYWNKQPNVLTLRYEDLYQDPSLYLKMILQECGYPCTDEDIKRSIDQFPSQGGIYKHSHHFTPKDLKLVNDSLQDLLQYFHYDIPNVIPQISH